MTFATVEARINNATLAHLANVTATVGGVAVRAVFDDAYADQFGIAGSTPALQCASADVAAAVPGTAVVVNGVNYTVGSIQPDGTGMTRLLLQEV